MKLKLTIIAVFIVFWAKAQTPLVFESSKKQSYLLNYKAAGSGSQQYINEMLQKICSSLHVSVLNTKVTFSCDENIRITKENKSLKIFVSYDNIKISGDHYYMDFDVSDEFIPSNYQFEGTLHRKNGQELKQFSISETNFSPRNNEIVFNYNDTMQSSDYMFIIKKRNFAYNHKSLQRFNSKTSSIYHYYEADKDLNLLYIDAMNLNTENFEQLQEVQQHLDNLTRRFSNIENNNFWSDLDVKRNDPLNLKSKMRDIRKNISDKQSNINYTRSVIHRLYFEKGVSEYNNNKRNLARNDFRQSISYNSQYPNPQYYLALMAYEDKDFDESMSLLNSFFLLQNIDKDLWDNSIYLAKDVESAKIKDTRTQISQQYFQEALLSLEKISGFCKNIRNYICNDSINILRANCHNNIYQKLISEAHYEYKATKFSVALLTVEKAINYQAQYAEYVNSNNQAISLKQQIKADQYLSLVKNGKASFAAKNYYDAFSNFSEAIGIEKYYSVKNDKQLPDLLKKSKLELLLIDADNTEKIVATNDLHRARIQLNKILDEQREYLLTDNLKLNKKIESLKNSIFSQQCKIAQTSYDKNITDAQNKANIGTYIESVQLFKNAISVSESNIDCQLNVEVAKNGIKTYENASKYQEDIIKCNNLVSRKKYSEATTMYSNLSTFYNQNKLEIFKIEHKPLHLYISQFTAEYIEYGTTYLVNSRDFKNAFFLLNELKIKDFKKSKTEIVQEVIAREFAIADFKENPKVNYKLKIAEYTKDDSWFKYFNKEYKKQIKKLQ